MNFITKNMSFKEKMFAYYLHERPEKLIPFPVNEEYETVGKTLDTMVHDGYTLRMNPNGLVSCIKETEGL